MILSTAIAAMVMGQGTASTRMVVAGYLPAFRFGQVQPEQLQGLTDVIVFSVQPTPEGEVDLVDVQASWLARLRAQRQTSKFRMLLTVGGWGRSAAFPEVARDAEKRKRFVDELIFFVEKEGFDGVDFDWEHPRGAEEEAGFVRLLRDLSAKLKPKKRLLTTSVAAWQRLPFGSVELLDRIHLTAYDHQGDHASLAGAERDVNTMLRKRVPASKIVLGMPVYGRSAAEFNKTASWAEIVSTHKPKPDQDVAGGFVFNGPGTVRKKVEFARSKGLAGVFLYEIGQDATAPNSLVEAAVKAAVPPARRAGRG